MVKRAFLSHPAGAHRPSWSPSARRFALFLLALAPACGGGSGSNGGAAGGCPGELSGVGYATSYVYVPGSGTCGFVGDDSDPMVAAANSTDFAGSEMCGQYIRVTGPLGSVDVRIVDLCPSCPAGDFDLNQTAFAMIGSSGAVSITWHTIPDPAG